jgi:hypothetical protein
VLSNSQYLQQLQQQQHQQQQQQQSSSRFQQKSPSTSYGSGSPYYGNTQLYNNTSQQPYSPALDLAGVDAADALLSSDPMYGRWSQGDIAYRRQQQQGKTKQKYVTYTENTDLIFLSCCCSRPWYPRLSYCACWYRFYWISREYSSCCD